MESTSLLFKLTIIMPVYNDWVSVKILLKRINEVFHQSQNRIQVLLVNDASAEYCPDKLINTKLSSIYRVDVLNLKRNMGHQRAIAIALTHLYNSHSCDVICVMDADGEDRPEDIPKLLKTFYQKKQKNIIFAKRIKRMEGILFKIFYRCYQLLHKILTGRSVNIGNFSIVPYKYLSTLTVSSELWNHYAAAVCNLKIPFDSVPLPRDKRITGNSKMNFISLVIHGLSAISVFGDVVGTRILCAACGINLLLILFLLAVFILRIFTDLAIPGWATFSSGLLLILFLQISATTASFLFYVLTNRNLSSFIPLRDYSLFIDKIFNIYNS